MSNEVVKAEDYELDEAKAKDVCESFKPAIDKKLSMIPEYEEIITLPINAETCKLAGDLRKRLVKVRTQGIEATRKAQKNFALRFGQFVDAFAKKEKVQLEMMESNLSDIEKHHENLEKERIANLEHERESKLSCYTDAIPAGLGVMAEAVFDQLLTGAKYAYDQKVAEEKRIEEERIAKEKLEKEEQERIRKENERLKKEAAEREKKEAAERAKREAAEKERLAKEKAEREERERIESERLAKEAEERRKIEEKARKEREVAEARLAAERKERERVEAEKAEIESERKAEEQSKALEEAERIAREKDKANRCKVDTKAAEDMCAICGDPALAMKIITAISKGEIENVTINY